VVARAEDTVADLKPLCSLTDRFNLTGVAVAEIEGIGDPIVPVTAILPLTPVAAALRACVNQAGSRPDEHAAPGDRRHFFSIQFDLLSARQDNVG